MKVIFTATVTVDVDEADITKETLLEMQGRMDSKDFIDSTATIFSEKTGLIDITDYFREELEIE